MTGENPLYLVDTTWAVEHLRGNQPYVTKLREFKPRGLSISILTVAQLWEGIERARDRNRATAALEYFLQEVEILGIDQETCQAFGRLSAELRRSGAHPGDFDVMIAATALQHHVTVLTHDKDFTRMPGITVIARPE